MTDQMDRERVKVVDRRWFTPEGELKEPLPPMPAEPETTTEAFVPATQPVEPELPPVIPVVRPKAKLPSQVLLDVVDFLVQHAMAFLTGQVPGLPRDPDAARLFADLLIEVKERTSGQVSLQEAKVLDDVLSQLRLHLAASR